MGKTKSTHREQRAQAQTIWASLCHDVSVEIHGDERDFQKEPLNDGEWMTVRTRASPRFHKLLNRAQKRAIGIRGNRPPETMSAHIKQN